MKCWLEKAEASRDWGAFGGIRLEKNLRDDCLADVISLKVRASRGWNLQEQSDILTSRKDMKMITGLVAAPILVLTLSLAAFAADQVKGGERLLQREKTAVAEKAAPANISAAKHCPKCKLSAVTYVDSSGRGAFKETKTVTEVTCPTCETKIVTTGHGKAKRDDVREFCDGARLAKKCCDVAQLSH